MARWCVALFLFFSAFSFAAPETWTVNHDHSQIHFTINYLGPGEVIGRFNKIKGEVQFTDDLVPVGVVIKIDAASIDTGNKMRDNHLRSSDFFKTHTHPEILFQSSEIMKLSSDSYRSMGSLTIGGVTQKTSVDFQTSKPEKDTWGFTGRFVKFKAFLKRSDFKINWNKTIPGSRYLVGDDVSITGSLQLQPIGEKTPSNKHMIPDTSYIRAREKLSRGEIAASEVKAISVSKNEDKSQALQQVTVTKLQPNSSVVIKKNSRSFLWWVSFSTLGMMGFFASVIIGLYGKSFIQETFPASYNEIGIMGHLSDVITVLFILIYATAFWYVGWG